MRAVGVHADVIVVTSRVWQTTCTLVRGGEEAFVIDSPVLPDELDVLPALLEQAGFPFSGLLATHADWDHLLGRLAFPGLALGCAESTARRLAARPGEPQRALRSFDEELAIDRSVPLGLGALQALPVPGRLDIADRELELYATGGHTDDGMALLVAWAGVLVAGDYLSAIEIPTVHGDGGIEAYLETLERLRAPIARVENVVPGHGPIMARERALELLEEDVAYLQALRERGEQAELPQGRQRPADKRLHEENVASTRGRA